MVGDDSCEGTHADSVTHQVDVLAEELLTPAAQKRDYHPRLPVTVPLGPAVSGHEIQLRLHMPVETHLLLGFAVSL